MESPEETSLRTGPAVASAAGSGPTGGDASDPAACEARSTTICDLTVFTEGHASRSTTVDAAPAPNPNAATSANGSATGRDAEVNASPASAADSAAQNTRDGDLPASAADSAAQNTRDGDLPASAADSAARSTTADATLASAPDPAARRQRVFDFLDAHGIRYTWYEHPEAPTIDLARRYWRDDGSKHCKNLFFRNHKGDRHYLVCIDCDRSLAIRDLEQRLRQGKLTFASPERMERWLGLRPGSVSPFGLINDPANHVHLFLDADLRRYPAYSFHPNDNRTTVVIAAEEFLRYLAAVGNSYEFIELY